jgi:hypothetical protein
LLMLVHRVTLLSRRSMTEAGHADEYHREPRDRPDAAPRARLSALALWAMPQRGDMPRLREM